MKHSTLILFLRNGLLGFLLILWQACTFTTSFSESPDYKSGSATNLKTQLRELIPYTELYENGSTVRINGEASNTLHVLIVTAHDLPAGKKEFRDLSFAIASAYKNALKDPKQYDVYQIEITSTESGEGVSQNRNSQISISIDELEKAAQTTTP